MFAHLQNGNTETPHTLDFNESLNFPLKYQSCDCKEHNCTYVVVCRRGPHCFEIAIWGVTSSYVVHSALFDYCRGIRYTVYHCQPEPCVVCGICTVYGVKLEDGQKQKVSRVGSCSLEFRMWTQNSNSEFEVSKWLASTFHLDSSVIIHHHGRLDIGDSDLPQYSRDYRRPTAAKVRMIIITVGIAGMTCTSCSGG